MEGLLAGRGCGEAPREIETELGVPQVREGLAGVIGKAFEAVCGVLESALAKCERLLVCRDLASTPVVKALAGRVGWPANDLAGLARLSEAGSEG